MFCKNCGKEIPVSAKFCSGCGCAAEENANVSTAVKQNDGEYDRTALKLHMNDLRALELIRQKLMDSIYQIDHRIPFLGQRALFSIPEKEKPRIWLIIATAIGMTFTGPLGLIPLGLLLFSLIRNNKNYKKALNEYEEEQRLDELRVQQENNEKDRLVNQRSEMNNEYLAADNLLRKCYSINIVPMQFRSLHAVFYLCDFLETSNEPFSAALLHCDLNDIKQRLDIVIAQNAQMLINQEIMIAQNDQIIAQNHKQISHLAEIESNSERAAQYAQIAAANAEACAWIGVANYIR